MTHTSNWTPSAQSDPKATLLEAVDDFTEGRFSECLDKHVWFHNVVSNDDGRLQAYRRSYAIMQWHRLAERYAPARQALVNARMHAASDVLSGTNLVGSFRDVIVIDRALDDPEATRALFLELHDSNTHDARLVYDLAQPVLVALGDTDVCAAYLDAPLQIERCIRRFRNCNPQQSAAGDFRRGRERRYERNKFMIETATVVGLLVAIGEDVGARDHVMRLRQEFDDPSYSDILNQALNGEFPSQRISGRS